MFTAPETFYRTADGTITTEPGEDREMVASCGAVMSKQEARDRGLLPAEEPAEEPANTPEPAGAPASSPEPNAER